MIIPVATKQDLNEFIKLPWLIYKDDKHWCPPFLSDCKKMFNGKHPFYEYGEMQLFLAKINGETVGRIAAIKNTKHNEQWKDKAGFFGFFESIDDQEVANALLDAAKSWLKEKGFDKMIGPASPSSSYDYGCQFTGFEYDQVLLSTHNAPYYLKLFENHRLQKLIDLNAYKLDRDPVLNSSAFKVLAKLKQRDSKIIIRELNKKKAKEEVLELTTIFNQAWSENHGFIPITDKEADLLQSSLKPIADPKTILLAEVDGKIVGGTICLLDYNQLFKKMKGRLNPWNFFKVFTQKNSITWLRCLILGVLPEYRNTLILPLLYYEIIKNSIEIERITNLEASYILENNDAMIKILEKIGAVVYKKYRVFETSL